MSGGGSVGVVIPTYNRVDLLGEAIASALAQPVPPARVIVVDDGSADELSALVAELGVAVRNRQQKRSGGSVARNLGGSLANGGWIPLPSPALVLRSAWPGIAGSNLGYKVAQDTEFFHRLAARHRGGIPMDRPTHYRAASPNQLSAPEGSIEKLHNATRSAEIAARLREPLAPSAAAAFADGRRRLLRRLAWTHLANFEPVAARPALSDYGAAGGRWDARTLAWRALSLLPAPVLRALNAARRALPPRGGR